VSERERPFAAGSCGWCAYRESRASLPWPACAEKTRAKKKQDKEIDKIKKEGEKVRGGGEGGEGGWGEKERKRARGRKKTCQSS